MNLTETQFTEMKIQALINNLAETWKLKPITVVVTGKLARKFGVAVYREREIRLNPNLLGTDALEDTVRHEFAHFLAFDSYGHRAHGAIWKQCARLVGAKPKTYVDESEAAVQAVIKASAKYSYGCTAGCTIPAYRRWRKEAWCRKHRLPLVMLKERLSPG